MNGMRIVFGWNSGTDLQNPLTKLRAHYSHPNYVLSSGSCLHRYGLSYVTTEGILRCDIIFPQPGFFPVLEKIHRLHWSYTPNNGAPTEQPWIHFSLGRGETPGDIYDCVMNGRLCKIFVHFGFGIDFVPWTHSKNITLLANAIQNYHEVKRLFEVLGCDYAEGFSDAYDDRFYEGNDDPNFDERIFRFAKEGRQILIRPLEQRRAIKEDEEQHWRVIIDPPK